MIVVTPSQIYLRTGKVETGRIARFVARIGNTSRFGLVDG